MGSGGDHHRHMVDPSSVLVGNTRLAIQKHVEVHMLINRRLIQDSKLKIQNFILVFFLAACSSEPFRLEDEPDPVAAQAAVEATTGDTFRLRPGESATID